MDLIDLLGRSTCPYCRARLQFDQIGSAGRGVGTASCGCYVYPIVDGIIVLRQLSGPSDPVDPAVRLLEAGDIDGARQHLRQHGSMVGAGDRRADILERASATIRGLRRRGRRRPTLEPAGGNAPVRNAFERARPKAFADYLFQRYANPSFMAAIPAMSVARFARPEAPSFATVLDLGCGVGHSTALLSAFVDGGTVVAADPDFVNLELLRAFFAPSALCVCLDAELPMPFDDDVFDAVVCLDAFHYIRSKWALAHELDRIVDEQGVCVLPHLHNSRVPNTAPGIPLSPDDYLRLFATMDARLFDEAELLNNAVRNGELDITEAPPVHTLDGVPNLTMVASHRPDVFRTYQLAEVRDPSITGVNPIYVTHPEPDGTLSLEARWPNDPLERECAAAHRHLPQRMKLDRQMLERLATMDLDDEDDEHVRDLMARSVLVELPFGYERVPAMLRRLSDGSRPAATDSG